MIDHFGIEGTTRKTWCCVHGTHRIDLNSLVYYHDCPEHELVNGPLKLPQLLKVPAIAKLLLAPSFVSAMELIQTKEKEIYQAENNFPLDFDELTTDIISDDKEENDTGGALHERAESCLAIISGFRFSLTESQMNYIKSLNIKSFKSLDRILKWLQESYNKARSDDKPYHCVICLNDIEESQMIIPCSHPFHSSCINKWIKINESCPLCREPCLVQLN
ncbi:hypothetical protein GWI33_013372 [Rhynchophorus ferrugineus]|uniref:RING-type E3 ubiquitin transferase n=1 Tax=Rhynchophorus ferrugineus TaxID=354439 RepID=A0A834I9B3_RHYFE|nr:hypothetical protein GWI33_013372 [Rhynchophorus ferrugineus]